MKHFIKYLLLLLFTLQVSAQSSYQSVYGTIKDNINAHEIDSAKICIQNKDYSQCIYSNTKGEYYFDSISIGTYQIKVTHPHYQPINIDIIEIFSGKAKTLDITMTEDIISLASVKLKLPKKTNDKTVNELSVVGTRSFSVEETRKYAAAVNDPARMATSFAGVVSTDDGNNNISIRGNSPNGIQWKMDGIEIPNPNHFSAIGSSGGGISILSSQLLTNSDFHTSAFVAEYGNATSGIFDLKLRRGNYKKSEQTFQIGFLGTDIAAEGPFKKGYRGSYLINYRYSSLSLLQQMGLNITPATTNFQDLSYKIYLPTKVGKFSFFGFNGISKQFSNAIKDSIKWKEDSFYKYNTSFGANTLFNGLTHQVFISNKSTLSSALGWSYTKNFDDYGKLDSLYNEQKFSKQNFNNQRVTLQTILTSKISPKYSFKAGAYFNSLHLDYIAQLYNEETELFQTYISQKGNTSLLQTFFHQTYRFSNKFEVHSGIHLLNFMLNNDMAVDPRVSLKYQFNPKLSIAAGFGKHSQLQTLASYFTQINNIEVNKNLKMSSANHYIVSSQYDFNKYTSIKIEGYYQYLYNLAISNNQNSTFALINERDGFAMEELNNNGIGINKGIETTIERKLHNDIYFLLSNSIFDSKYKAANKQWYNTRFNTNHNISFTAGKEWKKGNNKRIWGANIKTIWVGGLRETPINEELTRTTQTVIRDEQYTYVNKMPDYFRTDLRISVKRNYQKVTTTASLDIQNASNRQNIGGSYFDFDNLKIKYWYQSSLIPVLSYKVEF